MLHAAAERPVTEGGWFQRRHSFATDVDGLDAAPHLGPLCLLNEDRIASGEGHPARRHRDMEMLLWVLEGAVEHQDSAGHIAVIEPGELVRLRAGRGVRRTVFNASDREPARLLEFWIRPLVAGLAPDFERRRYEPAVLRGALHLIASPDGARDSIPIAQQARIHVGRFEPGEVDRLAAEPGRGWYAFCTRGALLVNGQALAAGDALELHAPEAIEVSDGRGAELLLFELPLA